MQDLGTSESIADAGKRFQSAIFFDKRLKCTLCQPVFSALFFLDFEKIGALENVLLLGFVQRTIATVKILTEVPTHAVNVDVMAGILLPTFTCLNQKRSGKNKYCFFSAIDNDAI